MSKISFKPADTGTATFTIEAPATNTNRTITLPDEAGSVLTNGGPINVDQSAPAGSAVIDSSGNVGIGTSSPAVALDVSGQMRASSGILFGTDTAASNTLDDYEEGTWTPTIFGETVAGTANYTIRNGTYQKVGDWVTVSCYVSWNSGSGGSGAMSVSGLPFISENITQQVYFCGAFQSSISTMPSNSVVYASIVNNRTSIGIDNYVAGGGSASTTAWATSGSFAVVMSYRTA